SVPSLISFLELPSTYLTTNVPVIQDAFGGFSLCLREPVRLRRPDLPVSLARVHQQRDSGLRPGPSLAGPGRRIRVHAPRRLTALGSPTARRPRPHDLKPDRRPGSAASGGVRA